MAGSMKTRKMREMKRWLDNMKAVRTERADKFTAPVPEAVRLPRIAAPKLPKPALGMARNEESANMFYTKPENRGTIFKGVTPATTV